MEVELNQTENEHIAIFAGGCFWCMEPPFEKLDGVKAVLSGYTGGSEKNPTYEQVSSGATGHTEAVLVKFDPEKVTYEQLVETFWRNINPTQRNGQFYDRGPQYRTGIFYLNDYQKKIAVDSKNELATSGKFDKPIATEITPAESFWRAEEYHQDYYRKNPEHYKRYKKGSGREDYIKETWSD